MFVASPVCRRLFAIGLLQVLPLALAVFPAVAQPLPPVELVKDLVPGSSESSIDEIVDANGVAFLTNGRLYRSDGTADGTFELCFCLARHLVNLNGLVLFQGYDQWAGYELFRSDGTVAGTGLVADVESPASSAPTKLTRVGDVVYFISNNPNIPKLWRTDGTAQGTTLVKTFTAAEGTPLNLIAVGGALFVETTATNGVATLWAIPTLGAPPQALRSFVDAWGYVTGNSRELFRTWVAVGSTLYFAQYTTAIGTELWKSDGTAAGTVLVEDLAPTGSSSPMMLTDFGGRLAFFAAGGGDTEDAHLWISDGTAATTGVVSETVTIGTLGLSLAGGRLVFSGANDTEIGMFSSDGTEAGTTRISPLLMSFLQHVTLGDFTYFTPWGILDMELWRTDGTAAGTVLVRDIFPGMFGSGPGLLTPVSEALFFLADDGIVGYELWRVGLPTRTGSPSTIGDAYTMSASTTLTVPAPGVLANDSANGGGALTAQIVIGASNGSLTLSPDGHFVYTPPAGFVGTATFTYRAVNAAGAGYASTVTITVNAVVQTPTTSNDSYQTTFNTPLNIAAPGVLANDTSNGGGAMTAELVSAVTSGALTLNANGSVTFTPATGFAGVASFTYRAVNSAGAGNTATVTITVNALAPTTVADSYSTQIGVPLSVAAPGVLGNDVTNGGGALSAQLISATANGNLALAPNGSFSYTPNAGFHGADSFTYRAANGVGPGNVATVSIAVQNITEPQPPTALYAASIVGNTVTLRFTAPTTGPAPTGYVLEGGIAPGETLAVIPTGSTDPIYTLVAPTGSFHVRMRTLAGAAQSGPSNEIPIHVNVAVPPSAPATLTGMAQGSTIALAWRNTFAGGAPGSVILDVTGSLNASLPLGLTDNFQFAGVPGGTYTLSLRASNAAGSSPSSNAITLNFPFAGCSGVPLPPSNFLAYRIGNTINVVWDPAATGAAPTGYQLTVTGTFGGTFGTPARSLSGTVGSGSYNLSVSAANACGASAATPVQTIVVP